MSNVINEPNDKVAVFCTKIDNGNETYTLIANEVSFGKLGENNLFFPENGDDPIPPIDDLGFINDSNHNKFYMFLTSIDELKIRYPGVDSVNLLVIAHLKDIARRSNIAVKEPDRVKVITTPLSKFQTMDEYMSLEGDIKAPDIKHKKVNVIANPGFGESSSVDLEHIDNEDLEKFLKERIFENDSIIEDICTVIAMNYSAKDPREIQTLLSIGPSGSGKTETYKLIGEYLNLPVTIYDCNQLSSVGYVGKDIEDSLKSVFFNSNKRIEVAEKSILVYDEMDKLASRGNDVKDGLVQDALLKVIEGHKFSVELDRTGRSTFDIDTSFMTKACLGAFPEIFEKKEKKKHTLGFGKSEESLDPEIDKLRVTNEELKEFGLKLELIGRLVNKFVYKELTKDDLKRILLDSKSSPLLLKRERYLRDFNTEIELTDDFIEAVVELAITRKVGARSLNDIISNAFIKCDRELLARRRQEQDEIKRKVLKLTGETIEDNRKFSI